MKHKNNLIWIAVFLFATNAILFAQSKNVIDHDREVYYTNHNPNYIINDSLSFYQRKGEWRQIIDDFWGAGDPLAQKQQIFNTFANYIQNNYPCFVGLNIDWDSLRTSYYSQINDSISRGRFSALMSHLAFELKESHLWAWDETIDNTQLNPGAPVYISGNCMNVSHFGATLSALPDSSLLVVKVVPNHPLDLQPGDIVLGYEGIPWKILTSELYDSYIPKIGGSASTDQGRINGLLINAGMNWHLFNTIDIMKYNSGDTLHLKTDTLLTVDTSVVIFNNPQVAMSAIPFPDFDLDNESGGVVYGLYPGTNTGYIYLAKQNYAEVDQEFADAVNALFNTDGLIIDIRHNPGGYTPVKSGLAKLYNFDLKLFKNLVRCSSANLYNLCILNDNFFDVSCDLTSLYDKPIAVLNGPNTMSFGDIDAYTLKHHPMSRFFGKPTNGAFAGHQGEEFSIPGWIVFCANLTFAMYDNPDEFLIRSAVPVDEDVWLEQADVANGEDTVVKKALNWIHNLVYVHDANITVNVAPYKNVLVSAQMENPNNHNTEVKAIINDWTAVKIDSVQLYDDGQHGDSLADDRLFANYLNTLDEQHYILGTSLYDLTAGTKRELPIAQRFTTIGPIVLGPTPYIEYDYNETYRRQFINVVLKNEGSVTNAEDLKVHISTNDPRVIKILHNNRIIELLAAGVTDTSEQLNYHTFDFAEGYNPDSTIGHPVHFDVTIYDEGYLFWRDSFEFEKDTTGTTKAVEDFQDILPNQFSLSQNYPNPFNPRTVISYQLPVISDIDLSVYNILGQKVATLVNKKQPAGSYQVEWDATDFASGVYLYRLTSGDFIETKKLVLLK